MSILNDIIVIVGFILLIAGGAILSIIVVDNVNTAFQGTGLEEGGEVVQNFDSGFANSLDFVFAVIFIGLPLVAFGLAFLNFIPSFFYWISIALVVIFGVIGAIIQDIWTAATTGNILTVYALEMPVANFILSNFMYYIFLVFFLIAIGTYVKLEGEGSV